MGKNISILFLIFFLNFWFSGYGQSINIDSLKIEYSRQKDDTAKALNLVRIAQSLLGKAQNTGDWDDAVDWAHKALAVSKKTNYIWGMGRSYWIIGICWMQKGNYPESIKWFTEGVKHAKKHNNIPLTEATYNYIAETYMLMENYGEALNTYMAILNLAKQAPDKVVTTERLYLKIGSVYDAMQKHEDALNWYKKINDDSRFFYEGEVSMYIAKAYLGMNNKGEAINYLQKTINIFPVRLQRKSVTAYKGILGEWLMQYGEAYLILGRLLEGNQRDQYIVNAVKYLKESLPLLMEGAGGKETLLKSYDLLKQACEEIEDHQNALKYTKLYIGMRDSIYNKKNYLKLADVQLQYEKEKMSLAMQTQREKEQLQEAVQRQKLLADQRLQQEHLLAEERITHEKTLFDQTLKQQLQIAQANTTHQKELSASRSKEIKLQAEKKQMNTMMQMGGMFLLLTTVFIVLFQRQRQQKKQAIERAEAIHRMAELEMQSLRSQLNPHFMFNSLNSIQELILLEENDKSHVYLARFSKLLRMLLDNAEKPFIPLQKELEFLQLYLGLENLRVPDLKYSISVDEEVNTEEVMIPNMILQPYIENAIWHGLSYKEGDRQLQLNVCRQNGSVIYEIEDNGVGRKKAEEMKSLFRKKHKSKGMELLDKRFKLLSEEYNSNIKTSIKDVVAENEVRGTLVTIEVPLMLSLQLQN